VVNITIVILLLLLKKAFTYKVFVISRKFKFRKEKEYIKNSIHVLFDMLIKNSILPNSYVGYNEIEFFKDYGNKPKLKWPQSIKIRVLYKYETVKYIIHLYYQNNLEIIFKLKYEDNKVVIEDVLYESKSFPISINVITSLGKLEIIKSSIPLLEYLIMDLKPIDIWYGVKSGNEGGVIDYISNDLINSCPINNVDMNTLTHNLIRHKIKTHTLGDIDYESESFGNIQK